MRILNSFILGLSLGWAGLAPLAAQAENSKVDATEFRHIVAGFLNKDAPRTSIDAVIFPPLEMQRLQPSDAIRDPVEYLQSLDKNFARLTPLDLYSDKGNKGDRDDRVDKGALALSPIDANQSIDALRRTPITVVIVPGIFGEFIETRAFEDVFSRSEKTTLNKNWRALLASKNLATCQSETQIHCDTSRVLKAMTLEESSSGETVMPLDKLLSVASIDDDQGRPLINMVLLNTPLLSLESVGTIKARAATFNGRLQKFFALMGQPKDLVLLGYSRGTMIGLEMLSQAMNDPRLSWISRVRGMVSLGGVTYGSQLADEAFNARGVTPAPGKSQQLDALDELLGSLQLTDDQALKAAGIAPRARLKEKIRRVRANTKAWIAFVKQLNAIQGGEASGPKSLFELKSLLAQMSQAIEPTSLAGMAIRLGEEFGLLPTQVLKPSVSGLINGTIKFTQNFIGDYSLNIKRFQYAMKEAVVAAKELSTASRLEWWRTHVVPTQGVRYYSIAASMTDPEISDDDMNLIQHQLYYNPVSLDFMSLLGSYREYRAAVNASLNDSQVAVQRVLFSPELSERLNPANAGLRSTFLGLVGATHWSMALREVVRNKAHTYDRFPREILLKSIATAVALDLEREGREDDSN